MRLLVGDARDRLAQLPDDSVDAVVTDPPYGLSKEPDIAEVLTRWLAGDDYTHTGGGFMGKSWDSFVPGPALWREVFRVLKPGGHALVFAGTRTQDLMGIALRLAGFEVRDCLAWHYATGFPKSLNVSKAIDKRGGANIAWFGPWLRTERQRRGITQKELAVHFPSKTGGLTGCVANWELGLNLPTPEQFNTLCSVLGLNFTRIHEAEREVIGTKTASIANPDDTDRHTIGASRAVKVDITAPATDAAKQWDGWGTALKPATEPILLVRKPLDGTVADNVLAHGVGALNIDASRIPLADGEDLTVAGDGKQLDTRGQGWGFKRVARDGQQGRWPANVLFDEHAAAELDRQSEEASRFFYVAKPSKKERNYGCGTLAPKGKVYNGQSAASAGNAPGSVEDKFTTKPQGNAHPTVKPVHLLRQLITLICPPGGVVCDPFTGSGTTLLAAAIEGFAAIGCELTPEYVPIIEARLDGWRRQDLTILTDDERRELRAAEKAAARRPAADRDQPLLFDAA